MDKAKEALWTKSFVLDTLINFLVFLIYYLLIAVSYTHLDVYKRQVVGMAMSICLLILQKTGIGNDQLKKTEV